MRLRSAALRRVRPADRAQAALRAFVRRSDDRRLERTVGSDRGLQVVFRAMAARFDPAGAEGFVGDVQYDLLGMDGRLRRWVVEVGPGAARARPGSSPRAQLTLKLGLADFVRVAAQDLDPGKALLTGRLDMEGDLSVALRLGPMFGLGRAM